MSQRQSPTGPPHACRHRWIVTHTRMPGPSRWPRWRYLRCKRCGMRLKTEERIMEEEQAMNMPLSRAPIRPRRCTEGQLKKVGVTLCDVHRLVLQCDACGQIWSPNLLSGGRLPRGYWKCPRGCHQDS
jgi:hypothetical protein